MRHILTSVVVIVLLFPALALGGEVKLEDLVVREGLFYKKVLDVPFTGRTTGMEQWTFRNGKKDGPYVSYYKNGQLYEKGTYKDGKLDGPWIEYYKNGHLLFKGIFK